MYLKFRCSRCKRLGEKSIEQDKWDDSTSGIPSEMSIDEKRRFDQLGKISVDEEIDFHFALEAPDWLGRLDDDNESGHKT